VVRVDVVAACRWRARALLPGVFFFFFLTV
jgi:hypothetical protein